MLPEIWRNRGTLLGPSVDDFVERFFYGWPAFDKQTDVSWNPRVDIHETKDDIIIDAELPGIDRKDIKVEVKDGVLSISGERKQERTTEGTDCCRTERHYGRFERSFTIGDAVKTDKIDAAFKDGVLSLVLPKKEQVKPKEIAVEVK